MRHRFDDSRGSSPHTKSLGFHSSSTSSTSASEKLFRGFSFNLLIGSFRRIGHVYKRRQVSSEETELESLDNSVAFETHPRMRQRIHITDAQKRRRKGEKKKQENILPAAGFRSDHGTLFSSRWKCHQNIDREKEIVYKEGKKREKINIHTYICIYIYIRHRYIEEPSAFFLLPFIRGSSVCLLMGIRRVSII